MNYADIEKSFSEQNVSLLLAKSNIRIKESVLKESKADYLPVLSIYADYEYYNSAYTSGNLKSNRINGPSTGLKLSYTVFDGFNKNRSRQIAQINYESAQLQSEKTLNDLQSILYQTYNTYSGALTQIKLETKNLEDARKNLEFAVQLYKLGSINEIEFRQIQEKEFESENRLLSVQYAAKIAELQLMQLSGGLK